ncbi:MAG: hypothetical protein AAGF12_18160 [Myxococcota bacterium]
MLPLLVASVTHAQPNEEVARTLFMEGSDALQAGQVAEACPLFEQSLAEASVPWTARNLGYCYHLAGRELEAVNLLQRVVAGEFGGVSTRTVEEVTAIIATAEARIASLLLHVNPPHAELRIDGEAVEDNPARLDPGRHVVSARSVGYQPAEDVVSLDPGETRELVLHLDTLPIEAEPTEDEGGTTWLPWVLGVGAGLLAVGGVVALVAVLLSEPEPQEDPRGVVPITEVLRAPSLQF